ncbi:hypothetical protein HPB52_001476 [Rhipicephalus sanguineus]|uniref:Uncharacterized protein n=1 Tax=Rhipicephalus sanguineus TaxID=34632 RepID=A0A9D4PFQ6_RHISA|nr:hypothetical protein HPB52_001476 [Rhipicephalus sanguineus]
MICKSSGLAILHISQTSESNEEIFSWNKLYLIYSFACISVCAIVELGFFYELWLAIFVHNVAFTTAVHVFLYVVVNGKAALNATLTFVKARRMQNFFNESSKYEQRVRFVAPKNRRKTTLANYSIRFLLLSAFAVNVCTSSYLSLEFVDRLGYGQVLGAALKLTCIAGNFFIFVFDVASSLVLRPCCEVIQLYIEHQHGVLRRIVQSNGSDVTGSQKRARLVERVRLNLCTVAHLKRSLNEIWEYAIAASGGAVLCASCSGTYLNFVEEFWTLENFLAFLCTVFEVLDFLDIAILSDAMVTELAGAAITYTVILVQTSDIVKRG